jgi:hypothetical protein
MLTKDMMVKTTTTGQSLECACFQISSRERERERINARNKGKNREYRKKASKIFNITLYIITED